MAKISLEKMPINSNDIHTNLSIYNNLVKKMVVRKLNYLKNSVKFLEEHGQRAPQALANVAFGRSSYPVHSITNLANFVDNYRYDSSDRGPSPADLFARNSRTPAALERMKGANDSLGYLVSLMEKEGEILDLLESVDFSVCNAMRLAIMTIVDGLLRESPFGELSAVSKAYVSSLVLLIQFYDKINQINNAAADLFEMDEIMTNKVNKLNSEICRFRERKIRLLGNAYKRFNLMPVEKPYISNKLWQKENFLAESVRPARPEDTQEDIERYKDFCADVCGEMEYRCKNLEMMTEIFVAEEIAVSTLERNLYSFYDEDGRTILGILEDLLEEDVFTEDGRINTYYLDIIRRYEELIRLYKP